MINFRYHLVSLAAVFMALALGIVLGSHYLADNVAEAGDPGVSSDAGVLAFEAAYAGRTSEPLLRNALKGRTVLILTLPGARATEVTDISTNIRKAGGTVVGEVALTSKMLDASNRQFAESVADGVVEGIGGDGYQKVGEALAKGFVGTGQADADSTSIRSAFQEGGLLGIASSPTALADLTMIVGGPSAIESGGGEVVAEIAAAFAEAGSGAAVVGPSVASVAGGMLEDARNSSKVGTFSTVDVTDTAAGRVVAVLALASAAEGTTGSWGTSRSDDGALPQ